MSRTEVNRLFGLAAGFVNHTMVNMRWPLGKFRSESKWKTVGRMNQLNMLNGIEGLSLAYLVRLRGDDPGLVRQRLERVRAEMRDPDVWQHMDL